jgi:hypothetical protein
MMACSIADAADLCTLDAAERRDPPSRARAAFHVAAIEAECVEQIVAVCLRRVQTITPAMKSTPMTASTAQHCRWSPTMRPKTLVSAAPSAEPKAAGINGKDGSHASLRSPSCAARVV